MTNSNSLPKVFFSYSYQDSNELKPVFREASIKTGFSPLFADEIQESGESVFQKIHRLIFSCDVVVVAMSEHCSSYVLSETQFSIASGKPVMFFVKKSQSLPLDISGYRYFQYEGRNELFQQLATSLLSLKPNLKRTEYIEQKREENTIAEILNNSLKKNVLVIGKDSDTEGLEKMKRIVQILTSKGYSPVILRELPEIKFLSLERKMISVGSLSRFIIAEDSIASGHIDELRLCVECQFITATIRQARRISTRMQEDYHLLYNFINRFCYDEILTNPIQDELCEKIYPSIEEATEDAISWAENRIRIQQMLFSNRSG